MMEIDNNRNISNLIASSISKLNLNTVNNAIAQKPKQKNEQTPVEEEIFKEDSKLSQSDNAPKSPVDVKEIQKYAGMIGEDVTVEEINYGLMYGRSVIADFSA